jgi:hypothetical protein
MAIRRQTFRMKTAAAQRSTGIEQYMFGLGVILLALATAVARAAA